MLGKSGLNTATRARIPTALTLGVLLGVGVMSGLGAAPVAQAPLVSVVIKPDKVNLATARGEVEVTLTIPAVNAPANKPFLSKGLRTPGLARPEKLSDLKVVDAAGAVPMSEIMAKDGPTSWVPGRPIRGQTVISYSLLAENIPALSGGPPIALRVDGSGISAATEVLIMAPALKGNYRISLNWDTSQMGSGAEGMSSFGDGNVTLPAGPIARLQNAFLMAGHLSQEPVHASGPFSSVWVSGQPPFDPRPLMKWTAKLHARMSAFFNESAEPPYRVFLRFNPMNAGGGAAFINSFVLTYGTGVTSETLKPILGHEMVHTFTTSGLGEGLDNWYPEGIAVYYEAQIAWRVGLLPTDKYLEDVNKAAYGYFTNAQRTTPEDQVQPNFWKNTLIRVLPYDRGAMYFAVINGMIQRASGGKRSVADLIRVMAQRGREGKTVTKADWQNLLQKELGKAGPKVTESLFAGGLMLPESGDFGPCFRRVAKKMRQFDLGFDNASIVTSPKIIRGLNPHSNAAKAGLRNGDQVAYALSLDALQTDLGRKLDLRVTRDGKTFTISYLPRGAEVDAYQWERVPNVSDASCRAGSKL